MDGLFLQPNETKQINQDLLIIKCPFYFKPEDKDKLYKRIYYQKEKGLVILPPGFEAVYIPHDCEVVVKTEGEVIE